MDLTNPQDLRLAMRLAGIVPKKGLGQHFLIDRPSLDLIVSTAEPSHNDTVLEIGPGLGVMTSLLAQAVGRVVAVEADPVLAELLSRQAADNVTVVTADILKFDFSSLPETYKVVANLPYYLTSPILRLLLESPRPPQLMSLLIQKEVAERITAVPGDMSVLALSVQYYSDVTKVGMVERHKFWPAPKVDSAIVQLRRRPEPAFAAESSKLWRLIKAGFGEKRRQLKNSLAGGLNCSVDLAADLLTAAHIPLIARAQELSLNEWQRLYRQAIEHKLLD
jgi:16S rRNA (adenine1518-N6/adenine1519-N6)-dimethyltransferase